MLRGHLLSVWFVLALVLTAGTPLATAAQDATPTAGAPPVVASGLTNPRGMTWGADGTLFVALAGNGGTNPAVGEFLPPPTGPEAGGGPSAAVASIGPDGCPVAVATGLPSSLGVIGTVVGVSDVAILGDQLYALVAGGGGSHGNPDEPAGLYRILADGSYELAVDLQAWYKANPVAHPAEVEPDGQWYGMVAAPDGSALWVVEANGGQVLTVTPDGTIARVADLSQGHPVPTGIALAPEGGVYVGYLTAAPFLDGTSRVDHVAPDGTVSTVWSGLTMVTGIAVAPDGTLYAAEMATGDPASMDGPPFQPFTGRVVRQTGSDGVEEVATGMLFPVNLRFGPDGGLYVALPAVGANNGEGVILQLDPATAGAIQMPAGPPPASDCAPITPPPPPPVTPAATGSPAASPTANAGGQFIAQFDAEAGELSEGVTVDADGTVYASLSPLGQLVRIGSGGEHDVVGTVEGLQEGDIGMVGITAHPDGSVYAGVFSANPDVHGVWRFDVDTGEAERLPGTEQIGLPNAIAFGADGTTYVTDSMAGAVWLVSLDGTAEQWVQHALLEGDQSIGFPFPIGANGIALNEASGTVYVAVLEKGTVVAIPIDDDGSAGEPAVETEFTDAQGPVLVDGIALDTADNLYVAQPAANTVVRVTPAGAIETVATQADGMDGPASVAVAPDGDGTERLYIANFSVALAPLVPPGGAGPGIVMIPLAD